MREPAQLTLPAVQQAFRSLWDDVKWLISGQLMFSGRKLQKIGNAAVGDDALPLGQAQKLFMPIDRNLSDLIQAADPTVRIGTLANRGGAGAYKLKLFAASDKSFVTWVSDGTAWRYAGGVWSDTFSNKSGTSFATGDEGVPFYSTDHKITWRWNGTAWIYEHGVYARTQSQVAGLAATLGTNDAGYLIYVTDYGHTLKWSGTAFDWAPGDVESGQIVAGMSAPSAHWVSCDGSSVTILTATGGTSSVTTPDLVTSGAYIRTGTPATTQTAATNPTWVAGSKTDNESAHTHDPGTLAVDAHTTSTELVAGAATVLTGPATHTISGATAAGSAHQHTLSDSVAKMNKVGDATWSPQNIAVAWYIRR